MARWRGRARCSSIGADVEHTTDALCGLGSRSLLLGLSLQVLELDDAVFELRFAHDDGDARAPLVSATKLALQLSSSQIALDAKAGIP